MRDIRLGDDIDDFCVRCKRVMNHNVVSVLNGQAAKVRCRTCHSDHDFRHEQAPPPKVDARKAALFSQVLANVTGTQEPVAAGIAGDPPAAVDTAEAAAPAVEGAVPDVEAAAPADAPIKAKAKASKKAKA